MPPVSTPAVYDSAFEPDSDPVVDWTATITASPDPGLLMRVLLKAAAPEANVFSLRYDVHQAAGTQATRMATIEIAFAAQSARARSVASKWNKLVDVHQVALQAKRPASLPQAVSPSFVR